jgi:hypothetical protein
MQNDKVKAARKAIRTLTSDLDFDLWADRHPNETKGLKRLLRDLGAGDDANTATPAQNIPLPKIYPD